MSDSPKVGFQWYWGGREGGGSPVSTPKAREQDDHAAGMSTPSAHTREENDAAELVLEQLDEQWFSDNVVRWPSSRPGSPPGVIDKEADSSPFRRPSRLSATSQSEVATGLTEPISRAVYPPRSRRLSDGDHHLRRYLDRDHASRLGPEDRQRRLSDISNSQSSSLPITPSKFESDESRFSRYEAGGSSPLTRPPSGPLMGVTEDEEMENDLFAKMLANRPAKLTTINPGRSSLGPLQENRNSNTPESVPVKRKPQPRQRRRLKGTKSLTDLEYEELRGFKDLGFEVSKDDLTPHVVRMLGLQRQGIPPYNSPQRIGAESQSQNTTMVQQKGLPHSQHVLWPRRPDSPMMNAPLLDPSIDMKGQLKSWASEMASIVSIEC
ncbi:hypothetical protein M758_11G099400 [Ceratodon purpureus]|nr:hypothetical protein M758_11G099400 [Ceratodon purpureus]